MIHNGIRDLGGAILVNARQFLIFSMTFVHRVSAVIVVFLLKHELGGQLEGCVVFLLFLKAPH